MFLIRYICSIVSILSITPFKYGQLKGYYYLGVLAMEFFHFMQGFLSSGTFGFHCTKNSLIAYKYGKISEEQVQCIKKNLIDIEIKHSLLLWFT